jgi:hypothetical protein
MSNVTRLFPTPVGFEVRNERGGWVIYSIYSDGEASEWYEEPEQSKIYQSLDEVVNFFGLAGIDKFTVRLGL